VPTARHVRAHEPAVVAQGKPHGGIRLDFCGVYQRAKQTIVISRQVETEPQEAHGGKEETYFDLTCSSTVLTVQPITLFVPENVQPLGSPQFLHHTSELRSGFAECRI